MQDREDRSHRPIRRFANWWETTCIEKFLEDIEYLLEKSAFLKIVSLLAEITIIISLSAWFLGSTERWEDEIFATWQVVKKAPSDKSGVARLAVKRLLRNEFSLAGLNLEDTNLRRINLQDADLEGANLQDADLYKANLQNADLEEANLQDANLFKVNFQLARLRKANLQDANLSKANLQQADLSEVDLQNANLSKANLQQTVLVKVDNINHEQIKSACFWDQAIYRAKYNSKQKIWSPIEPDNTDYIESLKERKDQDTPDCNRWNK